MFNKSPTSSINYLIPAQLFKQERDITAILWLLVNMYLSFHLWPSPFFCQSVMRNIIVDGIVSCMTMVREMVYATTYIRA